MKTILLITILYQGSAHDLIREMPNLDICINAMKQLERFDSITNLQCTQE